MSMKKLKYKDMGHVYIIEDKKRGLVKIGRSASPQERVCTVINSSAACGMVFIGHKVNDMLSIESKMHKYFSKMRVTGEWFKVSFDEAKDYLHKIMPQEVTNSYIERMVKERNDDSEKSLQAFSKYLRTELTEQSRSTLDGYYKEALENLDNTLRFVKGMHKLLLDVSPEDGYFCDSISLHKATTTFLENSIKNLSVFNDIYENEVMCMDEEDYERFIKKLKNV